MFTKRRSLIVTWVVLWVLMTARVGSMAVAVEGTAPEQDVSKDSVASVLTAIEQARKAFADWKVAIEAGAVVRDKDLASLTAQLESLGRDVRWIVARRVPKQASSVVRSAESYGRNTVKLTKAWVDQMHALGPGAAEKRTATLAQLRNALVGEDEYQRYAALKTLSKIGDVKFDKTLFRPFVLPLVKSSKSNPLVAACYALYNTQREPGDLALIEAAWDRRSQPVERSISHLLFMFSDGQITGRSEQIILELLSSSDQAVRREGLRGLWGATVSDDLANAIVELADNRASRHDAIYFGLSTLKPKSEAVVNKLIETLEDSDWNDWSRALWGLGYGVPEEFQPQVAVALADMYVARSDARTRKKCRKLIRQYAGEEALAKLPE